jgi:hypothetical protein
MDDGSNAIILDAMPVNNDEAGEYIFDIIQFPLL